MKAKGVNLKEKPRATGGLVDFEEISAESVSRLLSEQCE